ncbi:Eae-like protein [Salmonella enterica]
MQEVKIYTASPSDLSPPVQSESFCVDMVLASDYAELEAKYAALAADNDKAMESLKQADAVVKLAHEKFSALAAENEGLKGGIKQAFEDMEAHHDDDGLFSYDADGEPMDALLRLCDAQGSITSLMNYETPATDDFLAEVRAQGVERYAAQLKSEAELADETGWDGAAKFLISESEKVLAFAAQLRQEAAQ